MNGQNHSRNGLQHIKSRQALAGAQGKDAYNEEVMKQGSKVEDDVNNTLNGEQLGSFRDIQALMELAVITKDMNKTNTGDGFVYNKLDDNSVEPQMNEEETGDMIHKIKDIVLKFMEELPKGIGYMDDRFSEGVNPYYNQTEQGFFIEYYYGSPSKLWTPWGQIGIPHLSSSSSYTKMEKEFLAMFSAEVFMEETYTTGPVGGQVGPVYALRTVGGELLPTPKKRDHKDFLEYDTCMDIWDNATKRNG